MAKERAERVGFKVYVDILRMTTRQPTDAHQVEKRLGVTQKPTLRFLRQMVRMELMHVAVWRKPPGSRCWVEGFKFGPGVNAIKPATRGEAAGRGHMQFKQHRSQGLALGLMIRAMSEGVTRHEIHERTGIALRTLFTLIPYMMDEPRLIHVGDWRRRTTCGGMPDPIYWLGSEPDAPRPGPIGKDAANKKQRAKRRIMSGRMLGYSAFSAHSGASTLTLA